MTILQFDKVQVLGTPFASKIQISDGKTLLISANWYIEMEWNWSLMIKFSSINSSTNWNVESVLQKIGVELSVELKCRTDSM